MFTFVIAELYKEAIKQAKIDSKIYFRYYFVNNIIFLQLKFLSSSTISISIRYCQPFLFLNLLWLAKLQEKWAIKIVLLVYSREKEYTPTLPPFSYQRFRYLPSYDPPFSKTTDLLMEFKIKFRFLSVSRNELAYWYSADGLIFSSNIASRPSHNFQNQALIISQL